MLQEHRSTAQKQRHTEAQREAAKRETGKHEAGKKQAKTRGSKRGSREKLMQRRDFLKISAAGGAAAALEGCGNPDYQLIRLIPEEHLVTGVAPWKPRVCTVCRSGCAAVC